MNRRDLRKLNVLLLSTAIVLPQTMLPTVAAAQATPNPGELFRAQANAPPAKRPLPTCAQLGTDPAYGLANAPGISKLSAVVVPVGAGVTNAYCKVEFTFNSGKAGPKDNYEEGQQQALGIRVGLPLRADDGGAGIWNHKISNLGSGGCMGTMPAVLTATNNGYVGSNGDGGHTSTTAGFDCTFGIIQDKHQLNAGLITDFTVDHLIWQTLFPKLLTKTYYGETAERTYWSGCSQGGRQGHIIAQLMPEEYDGIVAGGAALYWQSFQMAQAWSGLVIKDYLKPLGKTLTDAQIAEVNRVEIAGCDGLDGVVDGQLQDPRTCHWSAKAAICGVKGAPAAGLCLDGDQAKAWDMIRQGPRNSKGEQIWFPWEPGTTFSTNTNYLNSDSIMKWAVKDKTWSSNDHLYLNKATLAASKDPKGITYEDMATLATQAAADLVDASDPALMAKAAKTKVKMLSYTGTADRNIQSRNSIRFYRDTAAQLGQNISDPAYQSWFRLFLYPTVAHCGGDSGPQPGPAGQGPLFDAMVAWVERGVAPTRIIATQYAPPPAGTPPQAALNTAGRAIIATRPVCAYPTRAIYDGRGDVNAAASFSCGGNLETRAAVATDKLAKHKFENGTGKVPAPYGI